MNKLLFALLMTITSFILSGSLFAANDENIGELSLDALLAMDVVTASKTPQKLIKTPAAIHVITQEDLRRSGINSIPEALRMVPGMHVYKIDANTWAVSARGFSSRFANKMLVMIDGRSVYTPLFSGVYWDVQDTILEDIDRIEIIRGPGGSLWGTNAVNGIINIITKDSADTQGTLLKTTFGTYDNGTLEARHGGWLNETTAYRLYGKFYDREPYDFSSGEEGEDSSNNKRGGFRIDTNLAGGDKLTLQGDLYSGEFGTTRTHILLTPPYSHEVKSLADVSGSNLLGRWNHSFSENSELKLQLYYDRTKRVETHLDETRDTFDVDIQHQFTLSNSHQLLLGLGYRYTRDQTSSHIDPLTGLYPYRLDPENRDDSLFSGFIQDRISFADDKGSLTIGSKFEKNEYSDYEWQPSARLIWNFSDKTSLWGAVSRTIRTPSRTEHNGEVNAAAMKSPISPYPIVRRLTNNDDITAERARSYELGFRTQVKNNVFVDISSFYTKYKDMTGGISIGSPFTETVPPTYIVLPMQLTSAAEVDSYGVEISCTWAVTDWWKLTSALTWFDMHRDATGTIDPRAGFSEGQQAEYQTSLLSYMDLPGNFELNGAYYYKDAYSFVYEYFSTDIDSYHQLDLNLVWSPTENLRVTVGGRNLLDSQHLEFYSTFDGIIATEIPRSFYTTLSWEF